MIQATQNPAASAWLLTDLQESGQHPMAYLLSWLALSEKDQEARWNALVERYATEARAQLATLDTTMGTLRALRVQELTAVLAMATEVLVAPPDVVPGPVDIPIP